MASDSNHSCAPLLQKKATLEDPARVIVTASIAGLQVGSLGENATFGYSASKGKPDRACSLVVVHLLIDI